MTLVRASTILLTLAVYPPQIASLARKAAKGHDMHPTGGIKRAFGYNSKPMLKHGQSETKAYSERDMSDQLHGSTFKKHHFLDVNVPLHPYSYVRMLWDGLMFILTVFALVSDPLTIAFEAESADGGGWKEVGIWGDWSLYFWGLTPGQSIFGI